MTEADLIESARHRFDLPPGDIPADYLVQIERALQSANDQVVRRAHQKIDKMRSQA